MYGIQLWGSCRSNLVKDLQIVQNLAARYVLKCGRSTKVEKLLEGYGWMTVNQLICFHSLLLFWKCWYRGNWTILRRNLMMDKDNDFVLKKGRIQMTNLAWKQKSVRWWNQLPDTVRMETGLSQFKQGLRSWVTENIPV